MSKFEVPDSEGKITNEARMGTGTIYHQISDRCFIIISCAHNFMIFKQEKKYDDEGNGKMVTQCIPAATNGTTFYLQRDGGNTKMEMRILHVDTHPDYLADGAGTTQFLKGSDIALAVAEIPYEKYRLMKDEEKKEFQSGLNIPEPAYFNHKSLQKDVNDIALVAGYPACTYAMRTDEKTKVKTYAEVRSENYLHIDYGHIAVDVLDQAADEAVTMVTYDELDMITSVGQSGAALQRVKQPPERMIKADPKEPPAKHHEILKHHVESLQTEIIGVHVGNHKGKNYATMFHEHLFLDFILPTMGRLHEKYGKGSKDNDHNRQYKEPLKDLFDRYSDELDARTQQRDILEQRRKEQQLKQQQEILDNLQEKKLEDAIKGQFKEIAETVERTKQRMGKAKVDAEKATNEDAIKATKKHL